MKLFIIMKEWPKEFKTPVKAFREKEAAELQIKMLIEDKIASPFDQCEYDLVELEVK